ncbi:MAG: hypothetical protein CMJ18_20995 [Phycisphaeraceae bacterium]|nr:hypothetical protein [Phycisphaeraceae bacterium]
MISHRNDQGATRPRFTVLGRRWLLLGATLAWMLIPLECAWGTIIIHPPEENLRANAPPLASGYVTQDIVIESDTAWFGAELIISLDQPDGIYQDLVGSSIGQSPSPDHFSSFPTLEFDTYMSTGVLGEGIGSMGGAPDLTGHPGTPGPSDINGDGRVGLDDLHVLILNYGLFVDPGTHGDITGNGRVDAGDFGALESAWGETGSFDASAINKTWFDSTGAPGIFAIARITLAESAGGTWDLLVLADPEGGSNRRRTGGPVVDGVMLIPEPTCLIAWAMFALILLMHRSRSAAA